MSARSHFAFPIADADLCVKCGLCLPHCPSYLDTRNEADSPRGRIALMQALAEQRIEMTSGVEQHLDACLGCRACERVCPAGVPYGALIDSGRELMAERRPDRLRLTRAMSLLLRSRPVRASIRTLLWLVRKFGILTLFERLLPDANRNRLARLLSLLPVIPTLRSRQKPLVSGAHGDVAIFMGCVGDIAERSVAEDLATLLAACGIRCGIPQTQTCCGAIDQHAGRRAVAAQLVARNLEAFAADGDTPILPLATGCAATLLDYPRLGAPAGDGASFAKRVRDPLDFLLEQGETLRFRALPLRVAIHEPCTQTNVIRRGGALRELLARIPQIEVVELDPSARCCGAAGSYFVTEPDSADRLLEPKLTAARALKPQLIVSANIGCSLHLAAGLRRAGLTAASSVVHPLTLLARQLA